MTIDETHYRFKVGYLDKKGNTGNTAEIWIDRYDLSASVWLLLHPRESTNTTALDSDEYESLQCVVIKRQL
ncbi:MAG: hypothetical protein ABIH03_14980 [Pseudomonadota bacterium]